jgi:hypothetical protein
MTSQTSPSHEELLAQYRPHQQASKDKQLLENRQLINDFQNFARCAGAQLSDTNFDYVETIGIIATAPRLLASLLPPLPRERDGLYSFAALTEAFALDPYKPGYLRGPSYAVMAHPRFRRGFHEVNNFAPRFIELFWGLSTGGASRYLALDKNRVRIDIDGPSYFERDTWFGAPFNQDVAQVPNGVTKLRPPLDVASYAVSFLFADAYCLDIKWSEEKNIKTFQALELKSELVTVMHEGNTYFPGRYIHAEFDISVGSFRHFDGAIQYYTEDEYLQRRESDLNHNTKRPLQLKARSEKLFKLNGKVGVDDWVEMCCHFFAGNPLAIEYFSGRYPHHVDEALSRLRERPPGDGET